MLIAEMPVSPEGLPASNRRRLNREAFTRLFQGYIADFGNETAAKIIEHLALSAGRLRFYVPRNNGDPLFGCSPCFRKLWVDTCETFGSESGRAIMQKILVEFGTQRVTFPSPEDLGRIDRNERIRCQYNGTNRRELGLRWGLHPTNITRIVKEQDN